MAGRKGLPPSSAGRRQAPIPLAQTAAIPSSAFSSNSLQTETKSSHHTFSASCSAQPGRGSESSCGLSAVATTSPSGRARTPFVLEVPMSTPRSIPLTTHPRSRDLYCPRGPGPELLKTPDYLFVPTLLHFPRPVRMVPLGPPLRNPRRHPERGDHNGRGTRCSTGGMEKDLCGSLWYQ